MKITANKKRNIIKVSNDFAEIEGISRWGHFQYSLNYFADIPKCIKNQTITVRISAYRYNPIVRTSLFGGAVTAEEAIKNIRNYAARTKDRIRAARRHRISYRRSDISSGISNEVAKQIFKNPEHALSLLGNRTVHVAVPTSEVVDKSSKDVPVLSISKTNIRNAVTDKSVRLAAIRAILHDAIDPSAVGEASFPINSHKASVQGLSPHGSLTRQYSKGRKSYNSRSTNKMSRVSMIQSDANRRIKTSSNGMILRNSLRFSRKESISIVASLASKMQLVSRIIPDRWLEMQPMIWIHPRRLRGANTIHFLFELVDAEGTIVDVIHRVVDHEAALEEYLTPKYPPQVWASRGTRVGANLLGFKQVDPVATEIQLYRKILNPSDPVISRRYKRIRKFKLTTGDGFVYVRDRVNNTNTCIYRALAVGPRGKYSMTFRNVIVKGMRTPLLPKKKETEELTHISIFAETSDDTVSIRVTNIPTGPCALYVTATDMTNRPTDRNGRRSVRIVGADPEDQVKEVNENPGDITFEDRKVQDGHLYEYRCVMIYPTGKEEEGKVSELHEFRKEIPGQDRVILSLSDLQVRKNDNSDVTVTFEISGELTDLGLNTIVDALDASGIGSSFVDEVRNDRSKLADILSYWVLRQDSITGETEDMGIYRDGMFVDSETSRAKAGVSALTPGRQYRYIVKVLLRSPETLFSGAAALTIDVETTKTFEMKIAKFFNPTTLARGTLPSTGRALGNDVPSRVSSRDQFAEGRTGMEQSIEANIPSLNCTITSVTVKRLGRWNRVYWTIAGGQNEVDHFIVLARYQGVKSVVGAIHNFSETGNYMMWDWELSREPGSIEYSVMPVYSDYTYGTESSAPPIVLEAEEPTFVVST